MLKILKILRAIILLPVSLPYTISLLVGFFATLRLATHIARTDRRRAAWLLLRLATFLRRLPNSKTKSTHKSLRAVVVPALLLQGAPWQYVRRWSSHAQTGFEFYFAEQRFDQALEAAEDWCRSTEAAIAGREAEMRAFFEQHGADLSPPARNELWMQHGQDQNAAWEADPQSKPPGLSRFLEPTPPPFLPFLNYYDAHLALGATRWIMGRGLDSEPMRAEFARQTADLAPMSLGLPDFRVSDASLRALGIGETELAAIQRASMEMR